MSVIVLLSPIHFSVSSFFELSLINLKPILFSIQREIIITSLFKKLTKVSTNHNFKKNINGIRALTEFVIRQKCAKTLFLYKSLFINQVEVLSHVHRRCITQVLLKWFCIYYYACRNCRKQCG